MSDILLILLATATFVALIWYYERRTVMLEDRANRTLDDKLHLMHVLHREATSHLDTIRKKRILHQRIRHLEHMIQLMVEENLRHTQRYELLAADHDKLEEIIASYAESIINNPST